jgi:hypothetical protein
MQLFLSLPSTDKMNMAYRYLYVFKDMVYGRITVDYPF